MNGRTILCVDDELLIALDVEDALTEAGFLVISAHSAVEAIAQLEQRGKSASC